MSIDQPLVIDFVSTAPGGKVVLTISDHLSWDETWHVQVLQDKINTYLQFIESGQIFEDYPNAVGIEIDIEVAMKYQPTSEAISFLEKVKDVIEAAEFGFKWKVLNFD